MADKKQPQPKKVTDLPKKPVADVAASKVKGGVMGPGTQTEDDLYVGNKKR